MGCNKQCCVATPRDVHARCLANLNWCSTIYAHQQWTHDDLKQRYFVCNQCHLSPPSTRLLWGSQLGMPLTMPASIETVMQTVPKSCSGLKFVGSVNWMPNLLQSQVTFKYTRTSTKRLRVAYNNAYRVMHYIPRNVSVRPHQVNHCVTTSDGLIRNSFYCFVQRCASSSNFFIGTLLKIWCFRQFSIFSPRFNASVWRWLIAAVAGALFRCSFIYSSVSQFFRVAAPCRRETEYAVPSDETIAICIVILNMHF